VTVLNLNAKRAARANARGEPLQMQLGEELFDLMPEMPIDIIELCTKTKFVEALRQMLARPDEDWDRLIVCRPTFTDVMDIIEFFGAQMGESLRSASSSKRTGTQFPPTGADTTDAASNVTSLADLSSKAPANVPANVAAPATKSRRPRATTKV
jgi:hypothetical protein